MMRRATARDFDRCIAFGRAFNIESGYEASVPFDARSFGCTLEALASAGMLFVADHGDGPVGMAGADVGGSIVNHAYKIGREAFFYIEPAHRKGVGRQVLSALELAAKDYGAAIFDVVAESGKRDEALARLYRAGGYSPAERTFRKVL